MCSNQWQIKTTHGHDIPSKVTRELSRLSSLTVRPAALMPRGEQQAEVVVVMMMMTHTCQRRGKPRESYGCIRVLIHLYRVVHSHNFRGRNASVFCPVQVAAGPAALGVGSANQNKTGFGFKPDVAVDSARAPGGEAVAPEGNVTEMWFCTFAFVLVAFDDLENGVKDLKKQRWYCTLGVRCFVRGFGFCSVVKVGALVLHPRASSSTRAFLHQWSTKLTCSYNFRCCPSPCFCVSYSTSFSIFGKSAGIFPRVTNLCVVFIRGSGF